MEGINMGAINFVLIELCVAVPVAIAWMAASIVHMARMSRRH